MPIRFALVSYSRYYSKLLWVIRAVVNPPFETLIATVIDDVMVIDRTASIRSIAPLASGCSTTGPLKSSTGMSATFHPMHGGYLRHFAHEAVVEARGGHIEAVADGRPDATFCFDLPFAREALTAA